MTDYREHIAPHQRIAILRCLEAYPQYRANASVLRDSLVQFALPASRDMVHTEIAWLDEQGLVTSETLSGGLVVATLTERGVDVALGRAIVPGVVRPSPRP